MDLKASLKNKDFWIFDLDNTLYPSSNGLMSDVSDRMTKFVSMVTDKSVEEALIEQKELFKDLLDILVRKGLISSEEQIELQSHLY